MSNKTNGLNLKKLKFKVNNAMVISFMLVIVLLLNIALSLLEDKIPNLKLDLTRDAITKLSGETKAFLKSVDESEEEIEIIYLKGTADVVEETDIVLKQYESYCDNITYKVENYHKNPMILESLGMNAGQVMEHTVVVANPENGRKKTILPTETWDGAEFLLESKVTNAIGHVITDASVNVCFAIGYGSDENYMPLIQALAEENINVTIIDLADENTIAVSDDVDVLMLLAPYRDLAPTELNKIEDYSLKGGNIVVALPFNLELPNLESYLSQWGIKANNDIVYEQNPAASYQDSGIVFYPEKSGHEITADIDSNIVVSIARSLTCVPTGDIEAEVLLSTSTDSAATPPVNADEVTQEDIVLGPFDIAYILNRPVNGSWENSSALIVSSTPSIWGVEGVEEAIAGTRFGNRQFVKNAIEYVSEKTVQSVQVPRKTATENVMDISDQTAGTLSFLLRIALPLAVIGLGFVVWFRRRNK